MAPKKSKKPKKKDKSKSKSLSKSLSSKASKTNLSKKKGGKGSKSKLAKGKKSKDKLKKDKTKNSKAQTDSSGQDAGQNTEDKSVKIGAAQTESVKCIMIQIPGVNDCNTQVEQCQQRDAYTSAFPQQTQPPPMAIQIVDQCSNTGNSWRNCCGYNTNCRPCDQTPFCRPNLPTCGQVRNCCPPECPQPCPQQCPQQCQNGNRPNSCYRF